MYDCLVALSGLSGMPSLRTLLPQALFDLLQRRRLERDAWRRRETDLDQAVERVIEGSDPAIRMVSGYGRKLRSPVATSQAYIEELVNLIPGTVEVNRRRFTADPRVHAFFVNVHDLQHTFSRSSELREFLDQREAQEFQECYALLCMRKLERTVFGMKQEGELLRKDVRQTVISFTDHQIYSPGASEAETREGLKNCMFELLIRTALERFAIYHEHQRHLAAELHRLNSQARELDPPHGAGDSAPSCIIGDHQEIEDLKRRIAQSREALDAEHLESPGDRLAHLVDVFQYPDHCVKLKQISLKLDQMGVKLDDRNPEKGQQIDLAEVEVQNAPHRVVVLARFHHEDILPHQGLLEHLASHAGFLTTPPARFGVRMTGVDSTRQT